MRPSLTTGGHSPSRDLLVDLTDLIARREREADHMQLRLTELGRRIGGHGSVLPPAGAALR
jgi:hypothetical protein